MGEIKHKFVGKLLFGMIIKSMKKMVPDADGTNDDGMNLIAVVDGLPLRAFGLFGGENIPKYFAEGMVLMLNGKLFKGLGLLRKK